MGSGTVGRERPYVQCQASGGAAARRLKRPFHFNCAAFIWLTPSPAAE